MGCGTCEAACPIDVITVECDKRRGYYVPAVDSEGCTACGLCLDVCPGASVDVERLADEFLDGISRERLLGRFQECYIGHASSPEIRFNSASGGLITALLIHALENGVIDGALVLSTSQSNALETRPYVATSPAEIIQASGSQYRPSASNVALRHILSADGRFAAVGLPCHIHAIRKWETVRQSLREKIVLHLGLFCANNNTYHGTEYFLRQSGIDPAQVCEIRYRSEGWPGKISVTLQDNTRRVFPRATTEKRWQRRALMSSAFHYDFSIPRCLLCPDQTAELADISFGDPWLKEYLAEERIGKSLIIVRNEAASHLLTKAVEDGALVLEHAAVDRVKRAQNYAYKAAVGGRIRLRKMLGRPVPDYGNRNLAFASGDLWSALRYLPSYFSHHRSLWPFLHLLALASRAGQLARNKLARVLRSSPKQPGLPSSS